MRERRCPAARRCAQMRLLAAGRGALFSRSGAVVLQHAIVAAAGGAGRELAVDTGSNGQRRHRRHLDPGNGRGGGDTLGVGVGRSLQESAALANHRHGLAQDKSAGQTAPAIFRGGSSPADALRKQHQPGSASRNAAVLRAADPFSAARLVGAEICISIVAALEADREYRTALWRTPCERVTLQPSRLE